MVQCCPMHASCTFPQPEKRDYGGAFLWQVWGGRKVFGSNGEKIGPRGFFVFSARFQSQSPSTCPSTTLLALQTRWNCLSLLWRCDPCVCADGCRRCLSAPDCPQGVWHRPLHVADHGCGARRKKGLCSRWVLFVLSRLRLKATITVCGRSVCLRTSWCCHPS